MNTDIEIELIESARRNIANKTTSLRGSEQKVAMERYISEERLNAERQKIFNQLPSLLLHASELPTPHSYLSVETTLGSLLVTRDAEGQAHVFRNSCRHRGAKLVTGKGCNKRLVCPYHAWSYSTAGKLSNVPGQSQCFPSLDKNQNSLISIPCAEKYGFIWLCPQAANTEHAELMLDSHLGDMTPHLKWMQGNKLKAFKRFDKVWNGNWKLFAEGGLETYHFAFAHKATIAPFFHNNIAVIDQIGLHFRVVMPTKALAANANSSEQPLSLHDCSHTLFLLMPGVAMLVQKEHVELIQFRPISVDKTEISVTTLIPESADLEDDKQRAHWQKNHDITNATLNEDWELGVSIQASINSGGLPYLQYGQNEWALHEFNQVIAQLLENS